MLRMNSVRKKRTDKTVVKEHIVLAAAKSFAQKGVKTVRMDDIAAGLSLSKRTLYELFHDKEDLLLDVMKLHREEMQEYMNAIRFLSLVVSCACSVSLRLSSDWCLLFKFTSSR